MFHTDIRKMVRKLNNCRFVIIFFLDSAEGVPHENFFLRKIVYIFLHYYRVKNLNGTAQLKSGVLGGENLIPANTSREFEKKGLKVTKPSNSEIKVWLLLIYI